MGSLIEREPEVAVIAAALDRVGAREGSLVSIAGPAGIGKTRLLGEARALARRHKLSVLTARGGELERDVTYGIARQLFERTLVEREDDSRRRLLEGAARLALPALEGPGEATSLLAEGSIEHGLYWLIANLAELGPLLLTIDDAHWSDAASLRFLVYLARRLEGLPLLLAVAARTDEPASEHWLLELLAAEPAARRLILTPLTEAGSAQLMARRLNATMPAAAVRACHEMTAGTPFFLEEMAEALRESGLPAEADLVRRIRELVPAAVTRSILLRLGRLGEEVSAVAQALAVAGDGASGELLATMSRLTPDQVSQALHTLAESGIGARTGTGFVHPIVRSAIYREMTTTRRGALHARVARALAKRAAPPEEVARHLLLTEPAGDRWVVATLRAVAARASARGDAQTAVRLLARALAEPPAAGERPELLTDLGEAALRAGALPQARACLREALSLEATPQIRVRAALALAAALAALEGPAPAVAVLEGEARKVPGEGALRLDIERTLLALWVGEVGVAQARLAAFSAFAGTTPLERLALTVAALAAGYDRRGSAAEATAIARRALGDGKLLREQGSDAVSAGMATYVMVMAEDFEGADLEIARLLADARTRGSAMGFAGASLLRGQVELARGELAGAAADLQAAWDTVLTLQGSPIVERCVAFAVAWLCETLLERGELEAARALVARASAVGDFERPELVWSRYARGLLRLLDAQDASAALEDFLVAGAAALAGRYEDRGWRWRIWAARAHAALGQTDAARLLLDEQLEIAAAWGAPGGLGAALRARAQLADRAKAPALLARAVEMLEDSGCRLELAHALVEQGVALRRQGERTAARGALERGMDLAARCEARPLTTRARTELQVLGARPRRLMFSGIEGLTATERRVAGMAANGLSNREIAQSLFVTGKTVESHLASTYRKLEVRSRRDLPAELTKA